MTDSISRVYGPAQPATSNATLWTVDSDEATIVEILVANTTAIAATLSLGINGTAATASNCFMFEVEFEPNSFTRIPMSTQLVSTDTITGLQGTLNSLTVTITCVKTEL